MLSTRQLPRGAARFNTPHGAGRNAGLHAGGHAGHGQRAHGRPAARHRHPDDPGQHLPPGPAAGRRGRRGAGRVARAFGLGRPDPHRQRRLPALQPGPQYARSPRRRPSFARTSTATCSSCRPSGPWRFKRRWAATWRWCWTTSWRCPTSRPWCATPPSGPSAGPGAAGRPQTRQDQALFAIVQGGLDPELRIESHRAAGRAGLSRLCRRRIERGRRRRPRCTACWRRTVPGHARRSAPLPDGRRAARGPAGSHSPGDRPVRLRDADPQRPQCDGVYRTTGRCGCATCSTSATIGRWRTAALARRAATAGGICGTCSWPTRCWGRSCSRCTT